MLRMRRYRVFLAVVVFFFTGIYFFNRQTDWEFSASRFGGAGGVHLSDTNPTSSSPLLDDDISGPAYPDALPASSAAEVEGADVPLPHAGLHEDARPPSTYGHDSDLTGSNPSSLGDAAGIGDDEEYLGVPSKSSSHTNPSEDLENPLGEYHTGKHHDADKLNMASGGSLDSNRLDEDEDEVEEEDPMLPPKIHWSAYPENYPVTSTIQLPTGKPTTIPQIQYPFGRESETQQERREGRLEVIRKSFKRSWDGYRERAWMHDELRPVTGGYKDPFCGWAATLVDALDTLWIMGLKAEFREAVTAVGNIDFTTSSRNDIPVFETTIRYLGGLLGAYDISGRRTEYRVLLDKAVELADVLMGAFDTPNRMPIMYYYWKPEFAKNKNRASSSTVMAEIGSLSMEFTHLAQVTGEPKYYDAIARITNAMEEFQMKSKLPGLWPLHLDASGCAPERQATGKLPSANKYLQDALKNIKTSKVDEIVAAAAAVSKLKDSSSFIEDDDSPDHDLADYDSDADPAADWLSKDISSFRETDEEDSTLSKTSKTSTTSKLTTSSSKTSKTSLTEVDADIPNKDHLSFVEDEEPTGPPKSKDKSSFVDDEEDELDLRTKDKSTFGDAEEVTTSRSKSSAALTKRAPAGLDGLGGDEDTRCPGGLGVTNSFSADTFTFGGMADSTYEYLPKQYLLLGGLEPKYKTMYERVMAAAQDYLLYRPMIQDEREVLFTGGYMTNGELDDDDENTSKTKSGKSRISGSLQTEVGHLNCFVGGMYGLGAKIFGRKDELKMAIKLTEGCVWLYQATASGIMPESSDLIACDDMLDCPWNQTKYWGTLDPYFRTHDAPNEMHSGDHDKAEDEGEEADSAAKHEEEEATSGGPEPIDAIPPMQVAKPPDHGQAKRQLESLTESTKSTHTTSSTADVDDDADAEAALVKSTKETTHDRLADAETKEPIDPAADFRKPLHSFDRLKKPVDGGKLLHSTYMDQEEEDESELAVEEDSKAVTEDEEDDSTGDTSNDDLATAQSAVDLESSELRQHEQLVLGRIKSQRLPAGVTHIGGYHYILRPEAIESVFYMYRITGDPGWREKGWRMFQAIERATRTKFGSSGLNDVTATSGSLSHDDKMESFWLAETLKYFYLLFSHESVVSLDEYVLNTEAHMFMRPEHQINDFQESASGYGG